MEGTAIVVIAVCAIVQTAFVVMFLFAFAGKLDRIIDLLSNTARFPSGLDRPPFLRGKREGTPGE